jgi:ubiquitin carboxyl-terminal hydrolase 7
MPESKLFTKKVKKDETYQAFKDGVLADMQMDGADARFWVLVNRQNKTVRPDAPVPENDPTLSTFV